MSSDAMADCVFPEDIIINILTRLPVKFIVRFKSVCKPWLELLSSPNFKDLHLGEFGRDPKHHSFIVHRTDENFAHTLSILKIGDNEPTILDHPFFYVRNDMCVIGCYNGLICLNFSRTGDVIHLWNPALNLSKQILPPEECGPDETGCGRVASLGFGYDAARDDYKVVRIVGQVSRQYKPIRGRNLKNIPIFGMGIDVNWVDVYSSNLDSWIRIKVDVLFNLIFTRNNVNVNGNPYWMARVIQKPGGETCLLVCFDVTEMVFKFLPFSPFVHVADDDHGTIRLCNFNGCLGALKFYFDREWVVEKVDVWVFNESEHIWRKNRSLECSEFKLHDVLQGRKNGEIIGMRDEELFVFEPESQHLKLMISVDREDLSLDLCEYTESLTWVKGMEKYKAR